MKALIIGAGRVGSSFDQVKEKEWVNTHLGAYKKSKKIKSIAICDTNKQALKQAVDFWSVKDAFDTVDEAMENFHPDIVSLCAGVKYNLDIIRKISSYNSVKLAWVEKPFSDNLGNANKQLELFSQHKIHFITNYQRRFDGFYLYVKEHLSELVGDVQKCTAYFSGGVINAGSHLVNLFLFYFGTPKKVKPIKIEPGANGDFHGDFSLSFENFNAYCFELNKQSSFLSGGYAIFEIDILGSKGRIDIKSLPFNEYDYNYYEAGDSRFPKVKVLKPRKLPLDFKRNYMENELSCLLSRSKDKEVKDKEKAIETLKIFEKLGIWKERKK